jgi:DNA polymerase III delta prime subunit
MSILYEKYRPKKISEFIGNTEIIDLLKNWLSKFDNPENKTCKSKYANILLTGSPGIGKTTLAKIILEEYGYEVLEFNASDGRNADSLDNIFKELFHNNTNILFQLQGKVQKIGVIMDEIDGLTIGDKGGMKRLQYYLGKNNFILPIILTSNISNYTCNGSKKLSELKKVCYLYTLELPDKTLLSNYINTIMTKENLTNIISPTFVDIIISKSHDDFRGIFNMISMIVLVSKLENMSILDLMKFIENNDRNVSYDIFQACDLIFKGENIELDTLFYLFRLERYNLPITLYDNIYNYISKFDINNLDIINRSLNSFVFSIIYENALYNDLEWQFFDYQCVTTVISVYVLNKMVNNSGVLRIKNSKLLGKVNSINANTETRIKISNKYNINNINYHYYIELLLNEIIKTPYEFKSILDRHNLSKEELLRMIKSADCKNRLIPQLKEIGIITQKELDRVS